MCKLWFTCATLIFCLNFFCSIAGGWFLQTGTLPPPSMTCTNLSFLTSASAGPKMLFPGIAWYPTLSTFWRKIETQGNVLNCPPGCYLKLNVETCSIFIETWIILFKTSLISISIDQSRHRLWHCWLEALPWNVWNLFSSLQFWLWRKSVERKQFRGGYDTNSKQKAGHIVSK